MKIQEIQTSLAPVPAHSADKPAGADASVTAGKASPLPIDQDYRFAASLAHRHAG